jgi:hypothetical protein
MGRLKDLLKRKEPDPAPPRPASDRSKRRGPRIQLLPLHHVEFRRRIPPPPATVRIANVSARGIGFLRGTAVGWPGCGEDVEGDLVLESSVLPVRARVVHAGNALVGCEIQGDVPGLSLAIHEFFRVELAATALAEVPTQMLQPDKEGDVRWFRGGENCELYIVERKGRFVSFTVTFYGHTIEGGEGRPLRYGEVQEDELPEKPAYKGSPIVQSTRDIPAEIVSGACRFIENIENLTPEQRGVLCALVAGTSDASTRAR